VITFTDSSSAATVVNWFWSFGDPDSSTSILPKPTFDYQLPGKYNAWLTVTSDHGCIDSTHHIVTIDPEYIIYVPNAFSPNNNGRNDTFFPKGVGIDITNYQMWIYDRWGNMIFTTTDWSTGW